MTIKTRDTDSMQPGSTSAVRHAGIRLIASNIGEAREPEGSNDSQSMPCVVLKSALLDKNMVATSVLTNLFKSLRKGERIEFIHRIHRPASHNEPVSQLYGLSVKVACAPEHASNLKNQVAEALLTAYPGLYFEASGDLPDGGSENQSPAEVLPQVLQFAPSGVVVTAKPVDGRFEQKAWQQSSTLGKLMVGERKESQYVWPFPKELANWSLTAPLNDPMELPETVEISIRVHAFSLNDEMCEEIHKTMFRVQSGNLVVFHPESPITSYSSSAELGTAAAELMRRWLRHPSGYAVDCVVRSSASLGEVAWRRLAADVFGERPFEMVRRFDMSAPQPLAQPTLAWACSPEQGIPALMPSQLKLPSLAVPRHYPAPVATPPQSGAVLGTTVCGRSSTKVALPPENRSRHVALFGATGSGKSSLLTQMIAEDIADPQRSCGIGLIDPHGDLYQRVLSMIPPERAEDVMLVDTSDILNTACINPLEGMQDDPMQAQFIMGEIMYLIEMLFEVKDSSGPMTRSNLRHLLLLSASQSGRHGTFLDAARILEDKDYCDYMLSKCKDRNVVDYWQKFKQTRSIENGFGEWIPYLMARLSPFITSPIMKRLINRPDSTIDIAQAMADKKIVLFNLSKGVLQDTECQVLGSLILMKFFSAALGRARVPAEQRAPYHLYVDEFQTFATDSVTRMFSEARKYGLCLTTANQSLGQLKNSWGRSSISESILANTATKFLFRLGPSDIDTLQPYFKSQFDAESMASLPDFHAVACMSNQNRPLPPFVFRANLANTNPDKHVPAVDLLNLSRLKFTVPIGQANKELMKLYDLSAESLGATKPELEPDKHVPAEDISNPSPLKVAGSNSQTIDELLKSNHPSTISIGAAEQVLGTDQSESVRIHHDSRTKGTHN